MAITLTCQAVGSNRSKLIEILDILELPHRTNKFAHNTFILGPFLTWNECNAVKDILKENGLKATTEK